MTSRDAENPSDTPGVDDAGAAGHGPADMSGTFAGAGPQRRPAGGRPIRTVK